MAKRKRHAVALEQPVSTGVAKTKKIKAVPAPLSAAQGPVTFVQIIAGSYDRILHGITATIPSNGEVDFSDTFLFNAHTSAIRCLAVSPPSAPVPRQSQKVILASGSTDERVNLYHLSAHPPRSNTTSRLPSLNTSKVAENPQNKELGALLHHASSVTALHFPTRSKLLSSAEDSTIAVTRTRDWSLLSTIKAPIPKPQGRPSGDTAPLGGTPAGVNDFAVHPSMKLMISVGKGEKCMRLWNLVTGKKAGVLNFGRELLSEVGEGKFGTGEGRKVSWGTTKAGDEFCVGYDRGILVFGMDSKPRCKVMTQPKTKLHQLYYITPSEKNENSILATSTEDGRILFFSTADEDLIPAAKVQDKEPGLPLARLVAQLGGKDVDLASRLKDFKTLNTDGDRIIITTASSDGVIRVWDLEAKDLAPHHGDKPRQVGRAIGSYETGNRITCLEAFVMIPLPEGAKDEDVAIEQAKEVQDSSDSE